MITYIMEDLTFIQREFIEAYLSTKGDLFRSLDIVGIEFVHFRSWRKLTEFDNAYQEARKDLINFMREDTYIKSMRILNDVFSAGYLENHELKETFSVVANEISDRKVVRRTIKSAIPPAMYNVAIADNNIEKALTVLFNEGIINSDVAKNIKAKLDKARLEISESWDSKSNNTLDSVDTVALIKSAVLGSEKDVS